jgi:tetratricopeptide (TPR) repeat protein
MRYRLLEALREYGAEQLTAEERSELVRRHAHYFLSVAEQAEAGWRGPEEKTWVARMEAEHDNLAAALEWGHEDGAFALQLAGAMCMLWLGRGHVTEGRQYLTRVLARGDTQGPTAARAKALDLAGMLAGASGDYAQEQRLHRECLEIRRSLGNKSDLARSLLNLAYAARNVRNDAWARTLLEESLAIAEQTEDKWVIAYVLGYGGRIVAEHGDHALGRSYLQRALAISEESGDNGMAAVALDALARVDRDLGDFVSANEHLREGLALHRDSGFRQFIPNTLNSAAGLAAVQGQPERATRLFAAAESLREVLGVHLSPGERERYERDMAIARSGLGGPAFAAAWAEGRAMSVEDAIRYALEVGDLS